MSIETQFQEAQVRVKTLPSQDNDVLLQLYALFKQATKGDADGKRPGALDFVARAKYDVWAEKKGLSQEQAMQEYVKLVDSLASA